MRDTREEIRRKRGEGIHKREERSDAREERGETNGERREKREERLDERAEGIQTRDERRNKTYERRWKNEYQQGRRTSKRKAEKDRVEDNT